MVKVSKKTAIIVIIVVLLIGLISAFILNNEFSALKDNPFSSSKFNLLITGYDSSVNGPGRADTIIVASVNMENKEIGALFIPRDTRVEIPGHGKTKINASHAYGGIELLQETLELFLDIPIDYYVETDFDGFSEMIDLLGGIEIEIEKDLHYVDEAGDLYIDLEKGKQVLNGKQALQYVRYREENFGDIGRIKRQQKFIDVLLKRFLKPDIIVKFPQLYNEFQESVNTNIPFQDLSPFVKLIKGMSMDKVKTEMVPGEPEYINQISYWIPEPEKLNILINNLIRSKEYIKNNQYHLSLLNGNGIPGLAHDLSQKLNKYGFIIDEIGNASNFDYEQTIIKYYNNREKNVVLGIQELIGGKIEFSKEDINDDINNKITIIIGSDYVKNN